jgi:hypothetical protein
MCSPGEPCGGRCPPYLLTIRDIVGWADEHQVRTGRLPTVDSGPVAYVEHQTWRGIDRALRRGSRGLRGGSSLARLLMERRGLRTSRNLPRKQR